MFFQTMFKPRRELKAVHSAVCSLRLSVSMHVSVKELREKDKARVTGSEPQKHSPWSALFSFVHKSLQFRCYPKRRGGEQSFTSQNLTHLYFYLCCVLLSVQRPWLAVPGYPQCRGLHDLVLMLNTSQGQRDCCFCVVCVCVCVAVCNK